MTSGAVLVIGGGGREHALAARLAEDGREVLVAPGNEGIAAEFRCLPIADRDAGMLIRACRDERVELAVVGPEAPLAEGIADALREAGLAVFGPGREGARLESSKWFAKEVMQAAGVVTARAERIEDAAMGRAALDRFAPPWVIKADGLAAGKGVLVTPDRAEAEAFLEACLSGARFGEGGRRVVIEEHVSGEELSVMAVCDGERAVLLPAARDYKRAEDGDLGPNTGGMGAYAPSDGLDGSARAEVEERIVLPVLYELRRRGMDYRGTLYCGLMRTASGFVVIEFNCRFGDPETEVILPLVEGDFASLLAGAAAGRVDPGAVRTRGGAAVAVALVDQSYPAGATGGALQGLPALRGRPEVFVRVAGGRGDGHAWRFSGGRVAYVGARGATRGEARERVYQAISALGGTGWRCRSDIAGEAAIERAGVKGPGGNRNFGGAVHVT